MNQFYRGGLSSPSTKIFRKVLGRFRTGRRQQINLHRYIQRIREFHMKEILRIAVDFPRHTLRIPE